MDEETKTAEDQAQTEGATKTEAEPTNEEEPQSVPKERFDEQKTELENQRAANETLKMNMVLLKANAPRQEPAAPGPDIFEQVGLDPKDPDDMPNQEQLKKIIAHHQSENAYKLAHIRFLIDHQDYPELVGTAEQIQAGQFAEPFREALKINPTLMTMVQTSANPGIAAYEIAKLHKAKTHGEKTTKKEAEQVIDEAVKNANRIKSASNVKGGAPLSEEGRYAEMDDGKFAELAASHGAVL